MDQGGATDVTVTVVAGSAAHIDGARLEVVARAELPSTDGVAGRLRRWATPRGHAHVEQVVATRALPELAGPVGVGTTTCRQALDVAAAPTSRGRRLTLSTRIRVRVAVGGREVTAERAVFVRRRPAPDAPLPPGRPYDGPGVVVVGDAGPGAPVDGPTRRPLPVRVLLLAGPDPVPAGRVEVHLVRHTRRTPPRVEVGAGVAVVDDVVDRRRLASPAVGAGSSAELATEVRIRDAAAQTSTTASGSVAWSVTARWEAGGRSWLGAADVVARVAGPVA